MESGWPVSLHLPRSKVYSANTPQNCSETQHSKPGWSRIWQKTGPEPKVFVLNLLWATAKLWKKPYNEPVNDDWILEPFSCMNRRFTGGAYHDLPVLQAKHNFTDFIILRITSIIWKHVMITTLPWNPFPNHYFHRNEILKLWFSNKIHNSHLLYRQPHILPLVRTVGGPSTKVSIVHHNVNFQGFSFEHFIVELVGLCPCVLSKI